jgi:hypothetical protein
MKKKVSRSISPKKRNKGNKNVIEGKISNDPFYKDAVVKTIFKKKKKKRVNNLNYSSLVDK